MYIYIYRYIYIYIDTHKHGNGCMQMQNGEVVKSTWISRFHPIAWEPRRHGSEPAGNNVMWSMVEEKHDFYG